jgi:signal peptidase II
MLGRGLSMAAIVVALDQLSKRAVLSFFAIDGCGSRHETVTSFFDLVLTCNRGVSFGLFNGAAGLPGIALAVLAAAVVAVLLYWLVRATSVWLAVAIGLIIGGAVGNVIDRLLLGGVVDFLDFHVGPWHWPAFNLADSAICIGVAAMLLESLLVRRGAPGEQRRGDLPP